MNIPEKDLERIIMETPNEILRERGLHIKGMKFNQERLGNYGVADIITFQKEFLPFDRDTKTITANIFELKKGLLSLDAFHQSLRYAKGIIRYNNIRYSNIKLRVHITLIGYDIDRSSELLYIPDIFNSEESMSISIYEYRYLFDGIHFEEKSGYSLIEENFKLQEPPF